MGASQEGGWSRRPAPPKLAAMGVPATRPRTSMAYTATFALLQASIAAVASEVSSGVILNPSVIQTNDLRPGTAANRFARQRISIITSLPQPPVMFRPGPELVSAPDVTARAVPPATLFKRSTLAVKFNCGPPP